MERQDAIHAQPHWRDAAVVTLRCTLAAVAALFLLVASMAAPAHAAAPAGLNACSASSATAGSTGTEQSGATNARITLNTASAAPGSQIVVRGTGWPASAQVVIGVEHFLQTDGVVNTFDGVARATATAAGAFTAPAFIFPVGMCGALPRPGSVAQIVAHTPDQKTRATAPIAVVQTPTLNVSLTTSNIAPGTSAIPVEGEDWEPGGATSLVVAMERPDCAPSNAIDYLRCFTSLSDAPALVVHAGADGRFSASVPLSSAVAPGTSMHVLASVSAPPYGDLVLVSGWFGIAPLKVVPTLALDQQAGPAGTTIAVSGDHWPAGKTVIVEYCRSEAVSQGIEGRECNQWPQGLVVTGYAQALGEATVNASGHLSTRVSLPPNARPGPVMFQVRVKIATPADNSYFIYTRTASFTVTQANLLQKLNMKFPWWPFAAAGAVLLLLSGLVLWRRGAFRARAAR